MLFHHIPALGGYWWSKFSKKVAVQEHFCRDREIDSGMIGSFHWNMTTYSYLSFHFGFLRHVAVGSTITSSQTLIRASLPPIFFFHHHNNSVLSTLLADT